MLVLARKQYESIRIGDDVTVTIYRFGRSRVHVGLQAPPQVPIVRGELPPGAGGGAGGKGSLVLTRRVGQSIRIDNDIVVTIVSVDRGKVRVGVEAPRDIRVVRTELLESPEETAVA